MKSLGVAFASEKRMRERANCFIGDNLRTELAPMSFPLKTGGDVIKNVPLSVIPHLWSKINDLLDQNERYVFCQLPKNNVHIHAYSVGRLTWHDGLIPESEIWLKIGGDKGGSSFKMAFQICNVLHPNSPENTCVFCAFEAPDNRTNIHIGLQGFREQVDELGTKTWR